MKGKYKLKRDYGLYDIYKEYVPEKTISRWNFRALLANFNRYFLEAVYNGYFGKMPRGCGRMLIVMKRVRLNQLKERRFGTDIGLKFLNDHTDGYYMRFKWYHWHLNIRSKKEYRYKGNKIAKKSMSAYIYENRPKYVPI